MNSRDIIAERPATVCIVRYRQDDGSAGWYNGSPRAPSFTVLYQVTLNKEKMSASGQFIRFGETQGDEIMGWQWLDAMEVMEVLGALGEDGKTVTPIVPVIASAA